MSPRARRADARYVEVPGRPELERGRASGVYYVYATKKGRKPLFKSLKTKVKAEAIEKAEALIAAYKGRPAGLKEKQLTIRELSALALADLEEQTRTNDPDGQVLRRTSTYRDKDLPYLRGKATLLPKDPVTGEARRRKGVREEGVIPELFGDLVPEDVTPQWWKTWVKRKGRKLGRRLEDIAKYLSLVLSFAVDEGYAIHKPALGLPTSLRKHKRKAVSYSDDQVLLFFAKAKPLLQDLIVCMSENPFRSTELAGVEWPMVNIHRDKKGAVIIDEETRAPIVEVVLPESLVKANARTIRLSSNAAKVFLQRWAANHARLPALRSKFVFPSPSDSTRPVSRARINRMWKAMKKAAGIPKETPVQFKWFRHNVYRRLRKLHGIDTAAVSQVGGTSERTIKKHYDIEEEKAQVDVSRAINFDFGKGPKKKAEPPAPAPENRKGEEEE